MIGRRLIATIGILGACSTAGCSSIGEPTARRTDAVIGGSDDTTDTGVVAVSLISKPYSLCSGALIAPNLVVTARHCVAPSPESVDCSTAQFGAATTARDVVIATDAVIASNTPWYRSREVRTPADTSFCGNDIALVILTNQLPSGIGVPLIPRIDAPPARGEYNSVAGYGITAPGNNGSAGIRRRRDGVEVLCRGGGCGLDVAPNEFAETEGICSGDSGGPAIDAEGRVIGITSRSDDKCTAGIDTDLASWSDWIRAAGTDAAAAAGVTAPNWAVTGSSVAPAKTPDAGSTAPPGDVDAGPLETTTRDSGVAPAPLPTGTVDRACSGSGDCKAGEACYSKDDRPPGICVAKCTAADPCSPGLQCDSTLHVCLTPSTEVPSTCAVRRSAPSRDRSWIAAIGVAVAVLGRRGARGSRR